MGRRAHEFIGIDGEGIGRRDGGHDYVLLAASDGSYAERYDAGGLSTGAILDWLCGLSERHPGAVFVAFGASYDFENWLRDAEPERVASDGYWTLRTGFRAYRVRVQGRHSFYLSQGYWREGKWIKLRALTVWDALGWFNSSFAEAIDAWRVGTAADRRRVRAMKARRARFATLPPDQVRAYCITECVMLADMMAKIAAALAERGVRPARWDGAPAGAAALLRQHRMDQHITRPAAWTLDETIRRAYFGGRIQSFVAGVIPEPVHVYDLRGAYPAEIAGLPSLHGQWRNGPPGELAMMHIRWECAPGQRLTPFPYRVETGEIVWPQIGEGWYWREEVQAAIETGIGSITLIDAITFEPDDPEARPFAWLADWYAERAGLAERGDPRERLIKLVANTIYGKIVQSMRDPRHPPAFQSYIWGGLVTARTRAKMLRAARMVEPGDLVAIATDGIFTRAPALIDRSPGSWSYGVIEPGLFVARPGVMLSPSRRYLRTRGYGRAAISYRRLVAAWDQRRFAAEIKVAERRFISAQWALFAGHPELWRRWLTIPRTLDLDPLPRAWPRDDYEAWPRRYGSWEPLYPPAAPSDQAWGLSEPYEPRAMRDTEDLQYEALTYVQPDIDIYSGTV